MSPRAKTGSEIRSRTSSRSCNGIVQAFLTRFGAHQVHRTEYPDGAPARRHPAGMSAPAHPIESWTWGGTCDELSRNWRVPLSVTVTSTSPDGAETETDC